MSGRLVFYGLFIFQIILGLCTVHIVYHWDENKLIDAVIRQYSQGSLLPEWYNYPSLIFYISYLDYFIWDCLLKRWISDFHIFNRSVFFIISQLPAFFIFNMSKERSKPWLGILACLIFFASWEYHYHSRWVAPDTIAATLGFIAVYLGWKNKSWASALFAGLAFGTKYTAGIFLIPLFIFFFNANWKVTAKNYLIILLCFIATFIITTPGILLEWNKAMADILWEKQHYATGHHVYTIGNGMDHLTRNLIYITAVLPSRQLILGAITTVFSAIGLIYLIRKKKYKLILLIAVFIFYLIYLSTQKVMFVRNLMIIWPMLVILITLGMKFILDKFKSDFYIGIPFALLITTSMLLVAKSDYSIIYRETSKPLYLLNNFINDHPNTGFVLSGLVKQRLTEEGFQLPEQSGSHERLYYAFYLNEAKHHQLPCNYPGWIYRDLGYHEVNFCYYPTYPNNERIILVKQAEILDRSGVKY